MPAMNRITKAFTLGAFVAGAAAVSVGMSAAPAQSRQMVCRDSQTVEARLKANYNEVRTARGVAQNGLVELYTSPDGTFTVVLKTPVGLSCLLALGEGWDAVKPASI